MSHLEAIDLEPPADGDTRRVLVISHAWYGDMIGGAFRLASEFAEDLAAAGAAVDYVCCAPSEGGPFSETEHRGQLTLHRYQALRRRSWPVGRLLHHCQETARIVERLMSTSAYDAVSGHSPLQSYGAFRAARRRQPRAFLNYTVHSPFDDELQANVKWRFAAAPLVRTARWIDQQNCGLADCVQADSQYTLGVLTRKYPRQVANKGCVLPGWVDYDHFSTSGGRAVARQRLGPLWQTEAPLFFTLRRLEARMGLDTLIEAAARVRDRGLSLRVLIGGGGALKASLEQLVRDRNLTDCVHLIGRVSESDLPACYAAADCFVLPTRALECFGLIVLEAFAAGTPVIASRAAAIPELADRQGPGWDFEPGDVDGLARRLEAFARGELRPTCDLLEIARQFDRPAVFRQWSRRLSVDPTPGSLRALPNSHLSAQSVQSVPTQGGRN